MFLFFTPAGFRSLERGRTVGWERGSRSQDKWTLGRPAERSVWMKRSTVCALIMFMAAALMLTPVSEARSAGEINAAADRALAQFTTQVKGAQQLLATAKGVLIFP